MNEIGRERSAGVEETAEPWEAPKVVHARPQGPEFSLRRAALETLRRYPKIMARLAE